VASTRTYGGNGTPVDEQSLGELFATATRDMSLLIHQEIELAKTELSAQAAKVGVGAGLLSGAGVFGIFTLVLAAFAGGFGFAAGLNIGVWAGFLCMAGVFGLVAAILAGLGVLRMKGLSGPKRTQRTVKLSIASIRHPRKKSTPTPG